MITFAVLFQSPDAADDLRYIDDRNNSGKPRPKESWLYYSCPAVVLEGSPWLVEPP